MDRRTQVWIGTALFFAVVAAAALAPRGSQARRVGHATAGTGGGDDPRVKAWLADPALAAALRDAPAAEAAVLEDQVAFTEIPAPPFKEQARAAALRRVFEGLGLREVHIDAGGNVVGVRPGLAARPNLVVAAHLDTVFPDGTDLRVKREGTVLRAPGIADDGRGLAVLVGVIRALDRANVRTQGTLTFVADVGEEGLGDLRGVKHLLGRELEGQVDAFVSIDGTGHGITNVAVGSRRYRVTFVGPGGHSFSAFGTVNPVHALGRAVARIAALPVPGSSPRTTFNVGRIGGGTSINAIAQEAWFEADLRSSDTAALSALDARFKDAVAAAARDENAASRQGRLEARVEMVGDRPAGKTPEQSPLVQTALAVNRSLGLPASLQEASTDANIAMSLGIPAITVGAGGQGSGAHTLGEAFDCTDSWKGTARVTALLFALAR